MIISARDFGINDAKYIWFRAIDNICVVMMIFLKDIAWNERDDSTQVFELGVFRSFFHWKCGRLIFNTYYLTPLNLDNLYISF